MENGRFCIMFDKEGESKRQVCVCVCERIKKTRDLGRGELESGLCDSS